MKRLSAIRTTPAIAAAVIGLLIGGGGYAIAAGGGATRQCLRAQGQRQSLRQGKVPTR